MNKAASTSTESHRLTLSIAEAAEAVGVSQRTLERALADGRLASVQLGRRRLIRRAALEAWLLTLEQKASA